MEAHDAGRVVSDRFEVLETLGRGGMGVVYRARDRERSLDVALKTLRGISPEGVLRFKSEFRALRDVRHPNLVELGELFENEGTWFFTMELIRGQRFLEWVRGAAHAIEPTPATNSGGPQTVVDEDATSIETPQSVVEKNARTRRGEKKPAPCCDVDRLRVALAGLARGLAALHAAGKVHRDIKPSNILVEQRGRVVLLDFGVVAELRQSAASEERLVFGTMRYMAPEQARGEHVGPAADWYAMGVLLFQALTGEVPFAGMTHDELVVLKQHVDVPPVSELADGVPPDLELLAQSLLDRDPTKRPTELEIFEALGIAVDDQPAVPLPVHDQVFVGRAHELDRLADALVDSRAKLATTIVEGESGVGKSAMVSRFLEVARERDPRLVVLRGRCHERERVPFNALDGVIDDLARFLLTQRDARLERLVPAGVGALLAVFPALRAVRVLGDAAVLERTAADVRGRAFAALRELLVRLCRRRATVIAIEDVQWADGDSCALLEELLRADDAPRLCVVATKRPREGDAVVARLGEVRTLALAGLDEAAARELVRIVAGDAVTKAAAIVAETRGHPLFVRELARQPVTMRLPDAIWARATSLAPPAQRLLATIAVAGAPTPRHVVFAAAKLSAYEAEPHVAALTREHLVRVHGPLPTDAIESFHDRIREAVLAQQSEERRQELHRAIAQSLEAAGAPAAQLVSRFETAGDHAAATRYLIAAAAAAKTAFAFGRAAELYKRALDRIELAPARRAELLVELGEALANDGRTAEAAERFLEAAGLEPPDSDRQLDLLRRAAERFLMSGRLEQGLDTTRAVLERAGMTLPRTRVRTIVGLVWNQLRMRGGALKWQTPRTNQRSLDADICWSIGAGLGMVDTLLGAYFSGRAARIALAQGNALQVTRGMAAATIGAGLMGRRDRAQRLLSCAERAATEDGSPLAIWYVDLARTGLWFIIENDFARAHQAANTLEAEWYAAGHGPSWETDVAMHFGLASQQMLGDFRELARRVSSLVHNAKRNGDVFQEVTLRVRFAVRHLIDDRPDDARADVRDALASWLPGTDAFGNQRAWGLWSRTRAALYAGTLDDDLEREWDRMHRSLIGRVPLMQAEWFHVYGTYLLARAVAAQKKGQHSLFSALCRGAERAADRLARLHFPAAPGSAGMLRAAIEWTRDEDRVTAAKRGLEACLEHGILAYAAFFKRRLGEAMGGDDGATLISQADALAARAGWLDPERGAELAIPTGRFYGS